jgi:hypothetical protein
MVVADRLNPNEHVFLEQGRIFSSQIEQCLNNVQREGSTLKRIPDCVTF